MDFIKIKKLIQQLSTFEEFFETGLKHGIEISMHAHMNNTYLNNKGITEFNAC